MNVDERGLNLLPSTPDYSGRITTQGTQNMQNTRWSFWHSAASLLATGFCLQLQTAWPLVLVSLLSFVCLWVSHLGYLKQLNFFAGPANWITAMRFFIVSYVLIFFHVLPQFIILLVLSIAVMMDVFDGYIARRTNSQSAFGALFDMEVDAFYVLAMGLYFWLTTDFGLWLLIPGCIRYVYEVVRILCVDDGFVPSRQPLAVFCQLPFFRAEAASPAFLAIIIIEPKVSSATLLVFP